MAAGIVSATKDGGQVLYYVIKIEKKLKWRRVRAVS